MAEVLVGVGSNIEPQRHVASALGALADQFGPVQASPAYQSRAVGFDGDDFINLVVRFDSSLSPLALSQALHQIEQDCGRQRGSERFAPRVIDLDILMVGDYVSDPGEQPELPRGEILHYAFVLRPLAELAPDRVHPVANCRCDALWAELRAIIDKGDLRPISLALPDGVESL
ncbi:2-amino-4-hydroxy-6-hydroxymethyldihydropteridine diphosphokinase [Natronospira proteinivora]|uniref:2-amino-4-hydroxy-6-hydroxymethyldihydropteridine diphosphokinase n=1 Tax=Natronospira proteinivora TaxID=1807133 RepID=A0ABT1GAV7_9GAMM|nr:2-amino-4-hydroxy-6-hydroxymethyldihydropteridine diphosphokinase [Natronospira proteinivora]MCP1728465.1 2-amino-4-hydroxy-6-hydroxymethyldihydropteridine diphosphokinase [Natronospira proteinivora]